MFDLDTTVPFDFVWFSVAAACLAMGCLVLELFAPRPVAQWVIGGCGLMLASGAAVIWLGEPQPTYAIGTVVLALPCLATWGLHSPAVRSLAAWMLTPRSVWVTTLVISLIGAHFLSIRLGRTEPFPYQDPVDLQNNPILGLEVRTDTGRRLPVFQYQPSEALAEMEHFTLADERFDHKVIRLTEPTGDANCHGWAFTGGKFAIRGTEVPTILADNGYGVVTEPQPGDLAIYTGLDGEVTHTGIVQSINSSTGLVLIESKWGALGVYLHAPEAQPFGSEYTFYRSARPGHQLDIVPGSTSSTADGERIGNDVTG
jgi:hypothetical protein